MSFSSAGKPKNLSTQNPGASADVVSESSFDQSSCGGSAFDALAWTWASFDALVVGDLTSMLRLRQRVFVVEQQCIYLDLDGLDEEAWHLAGWVMVGDETPRRELAVCLRVLLPGVRYAELSIGRVVSSPEFRGLGMGRALMREALLRTESSWPGKAVRISAQRYLQRFYESFGFVVCSAPYDEDGIEHVEMLRSSG